MVRLMIVLAILAAIAGCGGPEVVEDELGIYWRRRKAEATPAEVRLERTT